MISGKYSLQIQPFFLAPRKLVPSGEERGEMAVLASGYDPKRVSMGLTDRRKTAKNLADSRKNWKILTVSRKYGKKELTVKETVP